MILRRARIERFKKFDPPGIELNFCNEATGQVADRYLMLGDNAARRPPQDLVP